MSRAIFLTIILLALLVILSSPVDAGWTTEEEQNRFCITNVSQHVFHPGDTESVDITIKNFERIRLYNATIEVVPDADGAIKVINTPKQYIGDIPPGKEITVAYMFYTDKNSEEGVYYLPISVKWKFGADYSVVFNQTLYIGFEISGRADMAELNILNVTTTPAQIKPGKNISLNIVLENLGNSEARSIRAILSMGSLFAPIQSDNEVHISSLEPDDTAVLTYNMYLSKWARGGEHPFYLTMEYEDDSRMFNTKNTTVAIVISGDPAVYIHDIILEPNKLTTGSGGLLMISLINVGAEEVNNVKIRITGGDKLLTETYRFIGSLSPEKPVTTTFGVYADTKAKIGRYGLNIDISYVDSSGERHTRSNLYEVTLYPKKPFIPKKYLYAIGGLIAVSILAYLFIFIISRKEK